MKLSFFSNYLNEHQLPLCQAWQSKKDVDFTFVALSETGGNNGRNNLNNEYPFVLREYYDDYSAAKALEHAINDDVVIFGHMGGREDLVKARMKKNKLTFRATERLLKRGYSFRFFPPKMLRTFDWFLRYRRQNMYILCASAFTSYDLGICGWPNEKCFKWGYYPTVPGPFDIRNGHGRDSEKPMILWAARLLECKRPFAVLRLAERLKEDGHVFSICMAGDGPCMPAIRSYIKENDLEDVVLLLGMLSRDELRKYMADCDIFLMTSSKAEGWGVTVNESMGSGCAVVVSASVGSAPYLINDGVNGILYDDLAGDDDLVRKIKRLLDDRSLRVRLGQAAYKTVNAEWSAQSAADRFIDLCSSVMKKDPAQFEEGPCSLAPVLRDDWYHVTGRNNAK